jgi:ribonuclease HI
MSCSGKSLVLYSDGSSRGNPGPAAIGAVMLDGAGKTVGRLSERIGKATSNQAEYRALIAGLELALKLGAKCVDINLDSELVAKQLKGEYRVKNAGLKPLFRKTTQLLKGFDSFTIAWLPRRENRKAHELVRQRLAAL